MNTPIMIDITLGRQSW